MKKDELKELLRHAKTPEQRRACLEAYRKQVTCTIPGRERYRQMDRWLRIAQRGFRSIGTTE